MEPTPLLLTCLIGLAVPVAGLAQATVQFSATSYTVAESAGAAILTVQRTGDANTEGGVDYATGDGTATNQSRRLSKVEGSGSLYHNSQLMLRAVTVVQAMSALQT